MLAARQFESFLTEQDDDKTRAREAKMKSFQLNKSTQHERTTMTTTMKFHIISLVVAINLIALGAMLSDAKQQQSSLVSKKPPFNGSIFGKRSAGPRMPGALSANGADRAALSTPTPLADQWQLQAPQMYASTRESSNMNNLIMTAIHEQQQMEDALLREAVSQCLIQRGVRLVDGQIIF